GIVSCWPRRSCRLWRLAIAAGARPAGRTERLSARDRYGPRAVRARDRVRDRPLLRRGGRAHSRRGRPADAAADWQALRPARPAPAGIAALLCGGGRSAWLHHHGSADRVRNVDCARREVEAVAATRRAGADRHSSDFLKVAAPSLAGRAAAE